MRVPLALAAIVAAATPAFADDAYRWWTTDDKDSAQFGVPGTDDRAGRIDCKAYGGLNLMAPSGADVPERGKVMVVLQGRAGRRTVEGVMIWLGDGPNASVDLTADDDVITTLMAGGDVTIGSGGDEWTLPGKGAAKALKPVLATCAAR